MTAPFVDAVSPLSGNELVETKCKLASVIAGSFSPVLGKERHAEANVVNGIAAMQRFADRWPDSVPVIWSDFSIGLAAPYPRESIASDFNYQRHHIVREAYLHLIRCSGDANCRRLRHTHRIHNTISYQTETGRCRTVTKTWPR